MTVKVAAEAADIPSLAPLTDEIPPRGGTEPEGFDSLEAAMDRIVALFEVERPTTRDEPGS